MKKHWIGSLAVLTVIAVVLTTAFFLYLRHPVFGKLPYGERLAHIEVSPNYVGGAFQNPVDTPFLTEGATEWSIRIDNFLAEQGTPRPEHTIPTVKTDLHELDPGQDLVVWLTDWHVLAI